jgi:hypothetical protein
MADLNEPEARLVLEAVRRIDKLPEEAERAKMEMWKNYARSKRRRRGG